MDFLLGNANHRIRKGDVPVISLEWSSCASSEWINFFVLLVRYQFAYSNFFYEFNLCLTFLLSIHSLITIVLSLLTFSTLEILFKQISFINLSINMHSYVLLTSMLLSILLILLTNQALLHFGTLTFAQQRLSVSNQVWPSSLSQLRLLLDSSSFVCPISMIVI